MNRFDLSTSEQLLKATDVARLLNISLPLAYRLMQRHEIPSVRIGTAVRVKPSDLRDFIERSRIGAAEN